MCFPPSDFESPELIFWLHNRKFVKRGQKIDCLPDFLIRQIRIRVVNLRQILICCKLNTDARSPCLLLEVLQLFTVISYV